jgi:hypothetical protein
VIGAGAEVGRVSDCHAAGIATKIVGNSASKGRFLRFSVEFDEQFVSVAYNFDAEFGYRLCEAGHKIFYEPAACVHHLKISTRTFGDHLRSFRPNHAVGAYYYVLRTWSGWRSLVQLLRRPLRAIATRHHLRRPWWVPATLVAEFSGMGWALALAAHGPRYLGSSNQPKSWASSV